ncbi:hypothetical protein J3459_021541 [Metarhizium acridum]|nr:hypothetical protein J3459_021541 [Metarhizium acridum]
MSAEMQESDADDEDEEPAQRSISPRRDRRMEHIRLAVTEAFAAQQRIQPIIPVVEREAPVNDDSAILKRLRK